jgi:hypothetical protein
MADLRRKRRSSKTIPPIAPRHETEAADAALLDWGSN